MVPELLSKSIDEGDVHLPNQIKTEIWLRFIISSLSGKTSYDFTHPALF